MAAAMAFSTHHEQEEEEEEEGSDCDEVFSDAVEDLQLCDMNYNEIQQETRLLGEVDNDKESESAHSSESKHEHEQNQDDNQDVESVQHSIDDGNQEQERQPINNNQEPEEQPINNCVHEQPIHSHEQQGNNDQQQQNNSDKEQGNNDQQQQNNTADQQLIDNHQQQSNKDQEQVDIDQEHQPIDDDKREQHNESAFQQITDKHYNQEIMCIEEVDMQSCIKEEEDSGIADNQEMDHVNNTSERCKSSPHPWSEKEEQNTKALVDTVSSNISNNNNNIQTTAAIIWTMPLPSYLPVLEEVSFGTVRAVTQSFDDGEVFFGKISQDEKKFLAYRRKTILMPHAQKRLTG
jgi:hypothetical protein